MTTRGLLDHLLADTRYALRALRKQPILSLSAIATLALGIGANTALFTIVNSVLLKPLPYQDPDRLVRVSGGATAARFERMQSAKSFSSVAAFQTFTEALTFSGAGLPEGLKAARVSTNFLSVLGIAPSHGRGFLPSEQTPGHCPAILSQNLWNRLFLNAQLPVSIRLGGAACTVIGVLPPGLQFPFPDVDLWLPWQPAAMPPQARQYSPVLFILGRIKSSASLQQTKLEVESLNMQYRRDHPAALDARPARPESLLPLKEQLVRSIRPTLWLLMGSVALFLAIACANIANLFLARARSRSREVAVRLALGASQSRLTTHLLTESLLLAAAGGALGILIASWAIRGLDKVPGLDLPRTGEIHIDPTVLAFTTVLSITTGILFGLAPSRLGSRANLLHLLKGGGETTSAHRAATGSRSLLVVFQIALSTILLTGAILLITSLTHLRNIDLGFNSHNLLTMRLTLPRATAGTPPPFDDLIERVESIPGVRSAAVTLTLPATGYAGTPVWPTRLTPPPLNQRPIAVLQSVTPGYFRTLGIRLLHGRGFDRHDTATSPKVVIINESLARRFWPGTAPLGESILAGASLEPLTIVGIVSGARQTIADASEPGIYRPRSQSPPMSAMFAVRTTVDPMQLVNAIRAAAAASDRNMSITEVKTMNEVLGDSEAQRRGITLLLLLFAATGVLLAAIGVYGLAAYSVATRTREFGIRQALGAQPADVLRLVLGQGLKLTLAGSAIGLCGAAAFTRLLQSFLFEVSPTDPVTFTGVALLSIAASLLATYLPARHATRLDPTTALRNSQA